MAGTQEAKRSPESQAQHHPPVNVSCPLIALAPRPAPRTTCCCRGALRPSMRKFTPRRASPESLGHPCKPRLPEGAEARPCPGVGPREPLEASPGIPCSPGPAEPRRVAARRRVPRLVSSPRRGLEAEGILPPVSPDRHDSQLPEAWK